MKKCNHWWVKINPAGKLKNGGDTYSCLNCGQIRCIGRNFGEIDIWNEKKQLWEPKNN